LDSKEHQSTEAEKLSISNTTLDSQVSKKAEENGNVNHPIISYTQNGNVNRKNKNRKGRNHKKNVCTFPSQALNQEENKVYDTPNNFKYRSKNDLDLIIDNFKISSKNDEKEKKEEKEFANNNENNINTKSKDECKSDIEENFKLNKETRYSNANLIPKSKDKNNIKNIIHKNNTEEKNLRENLIIINDQASSLDTSPQIHKIGESISNRSMEKKNSQSSSHSASSRNEKTNLNDSTSGLKADKGKENSVDAKSNFAKNRPREDSILTEIQENLNENHISLAKFFVKDANNYAEDSNTEASKADVPVGNKEDFGVSNGAGEMDSISTRKMQLKLFLDKALEYKLLANDYFKKNKFNDAIREYLNV
jgi:hypothetical protein